MKGALYPAQRGLTVAVNSRRTCGMYKWAGKREVEIGFEESRSTEHSISLHTPRGEQCVLTSTGQDWWPEHALVPLGGVYTSAFGKCCRW